MARKTPRRTTKARTPESKPEERKPSIRRTAIVFTVAVLAIIGISIVVGLYFTIWQDLWSPAIRVNDETINMDYIIRRMKYLERTNDVHATMTTITEEELIRQAAQRYGIEVNPGEIDALLREMARGENETISESEFEAWYRNILNETKLSDAEYRDWLAVILLADRINDILVESVPTAAEQVHLYIIVLPSPEDAEEALARIEEGEDFSELARELSIDEETAEQGGDAGWWPWGGGLHLNVQYYAFTLEIGEVSDITILDEDAGTSAICMITEKQSVREIEEDKLETIKSGVFEQWLYNEKETADIQWFSLDGGAFDTYTMQWISLQVAK